MSEITILVSPVSLSIILDMIDVQPVTASPILINQ